MRVAEACANACALTGSPVHHHLATLLKRIGFAMARALTFCRLRQAEGYFQRAYLHGPGGQNGARAMPRALATACGWTTPPAGAVSQSSDPGDCGRNLQSWKVGSCSKTPRRHIQLNTRLMELHIGNHPQSVCLCGCWRFFTDD